MPTLTTIYKIKKGNSLSSKIFTLKSAREKVKALKKLGIESEVVMYKQNVQVIDIEPSGEIRFFKEWNENHKM
jgi:hypothetical protein